MSSSRIAQWAAKLSTPVIDVSTLPSNIDAGIVAKADRTRLRILTALGITELVFVGFYLVTTVTTFFADLTSVERLFNYIMGAIGLVAIGLTVAYYAVNQRHPYSALSTAQATLRQRLFAVAWWWFALSIGAAIIAIPILIIVVLLSIMLPQGVGFLITGWVVVALIVVIDGWLLRRILDAQRAARAESPSDVAEDTRIARVLTVASVTLALVGAIPAVVVVWQLAFTS